MRIQDLQEILTEYDQSQKGLWRRIFGPPWFIWKIRFFLQNLAARKKVPFEPTRELRMEELYALYPILLKNIDPKTRERFSLIHDQEKKVK